MAPKQAFVKRWFDAISKMIVGTTLKTLLEEMNIKIDSIVK